MRGRSQRVGAGMLWARQWVAGPVAGAARQCGGDGCVSTGSLKGWCSAHAGAMRCRRGVRRMRRQSGVARHRRRELRGTAGRGGAGWVRRARVRVRVREAWQTGERARVNVGAAQEQSAAGRGDGRGGRGSSWPVQARGSPDAGRRSGLNGRRIPTGRPLEFARSPWHPVQPVRLKIPDWHVSDVWKPGTLS
ncbi:hypothetical protein GGX14DRAFT_384868 [Mycena pura]|uniref:Uncharacterized protein n=1 Tax=Mycena pura TaxID=153505 RepID=A0AAD7E4H3_9AGAR|nr:hypothetical protein GGX14DRAFT_384868 [Mycena pura]